MRKKIFYYLSFFLFGLNLYTQAQVATRTELLRNAAVEYSAFESRTAQELVKLSAKKGWPFSLKGPGGKFALLTGVDMLGCPVYTITYNNVDAASTIRTNSLWAGGMLGLNLSGSDNSVKSKLAIWDGGSVRGTHVELTGRVLQKDNPSSHSDHATHVSGTLIASGINPLAKGMSYGLQQLLAYDFSSHISEMLNASPNLLISNHSYGTIAGWYYNNDQSRWEFWGQAGATEDYKFGYYSNEAQMFDSMAYNAPYYLIVKSAGNNRNENGPAIGASYWRYSESGTMANAGVRPDGISNNDGYDIISTYGTSKNILTVGAVNPIEAGYNSASDVSISSFSSWGPTDDGRIKPDVVADGVNLLSPIAISDNSYATYSGTSMAAPNASGSLLLLQEYYARLHSGTFLRSSSLKGLAIHTADEAGTSAGPDYVYGWGLLNLEKAANVITSNNSKQIISENILSNGQIYSIPVIASGEGVLKATLCWTDPKGNVETINILNNNTPKLIHDLDLRIKKGSTIYFPWKMDPANPVNAATKGDNTLDNVEQVEITDFVPGETYTIEVTHKGVLERSSQAFSLIISGIGGTAYCTSSATNTAGARFDSLSLGTFQKSNPAGCTNYTNNTTQTINLETNSTVPFYIKLSSCDASIADKIVKLFVDFNNDGDFADAGELLATSNVINGTGSFTSNVLIPAGLKTGIYTLLRIVVQETANAGDVIACGTYTKGETQDYRVLITAPSNDMGVSAIVSPINAGCADAAQYVTVSLKNYGKSSQTAIPISLLVKQGATTVASVNTTYPGTIAGSATVNFTIQTTYNSEAGKTYNITASTGLSTDQSSANNSYTGTVSVQSKSAMPDGIVEICGSQTAYLKVNSPSTNEFYSWYQTAASTSSIATGYNTSTTVIPSNKTYYVAKNDFSTQVGPADKLLLGAGGYNTFSGNFVRFTNNVPVVIKSARLYIGFPGKINFIIADLASYNESTGSYSYYTLASKTIDVYATDPTPLSGAQSGNDPADLGAVYQLNLPVTTPGDHIIIVQCLNNATIFRNNGIASNPYPYSIPGIFSITGNSVIPASNPAAFYYFFYDMKIDAGLCSSDRKAVVANDAAVPTISVNGNTLTSSAAASYQWYLNGGIINGASNISYTATQAGVYKVTTVDAFGCTQTSADLNFYMTGVTGVNAAEIGLLTLPNPNRGKFQLIFEMKKRSDLYISLLNITGQVVYKKTYSNFAGVFNEEILTNNLPGGMYLLKIDAGSKSYLKKITVNNE